MQTIDEIIEELVAEQFEISARDVRDQLRPTMWHDLAEQFEDTLNDTYGHVEVCGYKYEAGTILRTIDPIAFQEECSNYWDANDDVYIYDPASSEQTYYSIEAIKDLAYDIRTEQRNSRKNA
jgi:hypothetical protein